MDGPLSERPGDGSGSTGTTSRDGAVAAEQRYVAALYDRLDVLRARTAEEFDRVQRQGTSGTHQGRSERDSLASLHADRMARLSGVENGLCFGRLDRTDGERFYVGRLGILDDDLEPLLVDWRAPVAGPFYRATAASPEGVVRRRHIRTRGRSVVAVDDDVFDLDALGDGDRASLNGEAALLAGLREGRTGRMSDIVATIQSEQDRVIRSELPGILVVQGGPGTGKTVVALHRAAYLLYTHRDRIARRGVLVVGPNPTFLRYIEQVLPSLGETDVLLTTVGRLHPGVTATAEDAPEVAAVKGDIRMARVVATAVRDRQWVPSKPLRIAFDGGTLTVDPRAAEQARTRARRSRVPHNRGRRIFEREILTALVRQSSRQHGRHLFDDDDLAVTRAELAGDPAVRAALDRMWPLLTPERLLADLYASPRRLAAAARSLRAEERDLLRRDRGDGGGDSAGNGVGPEWTVADVPLLDEAAELLGADGEAEERARLEEERERRAEAAYAAGVLDMLDMGQVIDIDPELLAAQYRGGRERAGAAERASGDRDWTFGHVIVDEAQELSPMAWRVLMRRCPSRSMTVVGDVAQTGSAAGATSWAQVLDPHAAGHWRQRELTLNYRTPAPVMAVAAAVLAAGADGGDGARPPVAVRTEGDPPYAVRAEPADLARVLADAVGRESDALGDGRIAVLVPPSARDALAGAVRGRVPDTAVGTAPETLDARVAVLTVAEAKGLEFDAVLVVEPARMLVESPRGRNDLYVALTRSTRRLGIVHTGPLPAEVAAALPSAALEHAT